MPNYMGLFDYTTINLNSGGLFEFKDAYLTKVFPNFFATHATVIMNPIKGTIWVYTDYMNVSREITINEWIVHRLSRTDDYTF